MALNIDLDDIVPTAVCPECEAHVHICDGCLDIIHEDETLITSSEGFFCGQCWAKRLGRCRRRKL